MESCTGRRKRQELKKLSQPAPMNVMVLENPLVFPFVATLFSLLTWFLGCQEVSLPLTIVVSLTIFSPPLLLALGLCLSLHISKSN